MADASYGPPKLSGAAKSALKKQLLTKQSTKVSKIKKKARKQLGTDAPAELGTTAKGK